MIRSAERHGGRCLIARVGRQGFMRAAQIEFLDVAAAIGFDPAGVVRALRRK